MLGGREGSSRQPPRKAGKPATRAGTQTLSLKASKFSKNPLHFEPEASFCCKNTVFLPSRLHEGLPTIGCMLLANVPSVLASFEAKVPEKSRTEMTGRSGS